MELADRSAAHGDLAALLSNGVIDAAIVDPVPVDPRVAPVVPDADTVWRAWQRRTGAQTLNHVVVVRESLDHDDLRVRELFGLFRDSFESSAAGTACTPIGLAAIRRSLEVAIAAAEAQDLLARPLSVSDLVTPPLAALA